MSRLAAFAAPIASGPMPFLLSTAAAAYAVLAALPQVYGVAAICGRLDILEVWVFLSTVPWSLGIKPLVADWALMVVAMMTPLVSLHVAHTAVSSRTERQILAVASFLLAYWSMWCIVILILMPAAVVLTSRIGALADLPVAVAIALIYSGSPAAQRARNLCHKTGPIPAFGLGIVTGSARLGLTLGARCVAACWPWMLVPLTVQTGHVPVALLVGAYLFAERISPPAPSSWRVPPAIETVLGQTRTSEPHSATSGSFRSILKRRGLPKGLRGEQKFHRGSQTRGAD